MSMKGDGDAAAGDTPPTTQYLIVPTPTSSSEVESNEDQPNGFSSERYSLRFVSTKRKRVPVGFINLDRAIDCLGLEQFPESWCSSEAWLFMPFMKISGKGYCNRTIEGRGISRKIVDNPIQFDNNMKTDLAECCKLYKSVCLRLVYIIQSGFVKAYMMSLDGHIEEITALRLGIWNNRYNSIFYTGYIKNANDKRFYRILIGEESFEEYMILGIDNRPTAGNDVLLKRIRRVIEAWAKLGDYKITRDSFDTLVLPVLTDLKIERLKAFLEEDVWQKLSAKQPRGQPKKDHTMAFERDATQLREALKKQLTRP